MATYIPKTITPCTATPCLTAGWFSRQHWSGEQPEELPVDLGSAVYCQGSQSQPAQAPSWSLPEVAPRQEDWSVRVCMCFNSEHRLYMLSQQ